MNKMKLILAATMAIAAAALTPVFGLTVTDVESVGSYTISQQNNDVGPSGGHSNADTATGITGDHYGTTETFTIPSNLVGASGAELTDIYVIVGSTAAIGAAPTLTIGSVSGGALTAIDKESTTGVTGGNGAVLEFALSDYVVLQDTGTYSFTISTTTDPFSLDSSRTTDFTGGTTGTAGNLAENYPTSDTFTAKSGALTFYIDTVPVPEPADWALVPVIGTIAFFGLRRFRFAAIV